MLNLIKNQYKITTNEMHNGTKETNNLANNANARQELV